MSISGRSDDAGAGVSSVHVPPKHVYLIHAGSRVVFETEVFPGDTSRRVLERVGLEPTAFALLGPDRLRFAEDAPVVYGLVVDGGGIGLVSRDFAGTWTHGDARRN